MGLFDWISLPRREINLNEIELSLEQIVEKLTLEELYDLRNEMNRDLLQANREVRDCSCKCEYLVGKYNFSKQFIDLESFRAYISDCIDKINDQIDIIRDSK